MEEWRTHMKILFYNPCHGVEEDVLGAATFGFVGQEDETADSYVEFREELKGVMITGSYEECLSQIPEGSWQAAIVLLGNAGGENAFVHALKEKVHVPLVGGGAAIDPISGQAGLITGKNQAAVFLLADDRYEVEVSCENIHHDILGEYELTFTDPRILEQIDGVDAECWLREKKAELGLAETDFEHLTFADENGINAHLSLKDGKICSGRDLCPRMQLRFVPAERVGERMQAFYDDGDALVFGCAGLKGILSGKLQSSGVGLFLFGEICTRNGVSEFGNLMLSKICLRKRPE